MSRDGNQLRDGVLHVEELPMAASRGLAYQIMRDAGPVVRDAHGAFLITEAAAASYALRHPELFSSKKAFDSLGSPIPIVPVAADPPEHTRYRRLLRAQVFLTLFGLPPQDRDRLIAWKEAVLGAVGISGAEPASDANIALAAELYEYLVGHIAERREKHGDDILSQLAADTSEERMTDEEILGLSFLFVLAGLDTVTSALSTAFATLAGQPELRRQIANDPAVIPAAVEELLRADGPVVTVPRVATRDMELAGQLIPGGAHVAVAIGAANHDTSEYADPDTVDFGRDTHNLAFGGGPHGCLGAHLARMEMRVAIEERHRRIPDYQIAPGASVSAGWPAALIGLDSLPLVFDTYQPVSDSG